VACTYKLSSLWQDVNTKYYNHQGVCKYKNTSAGIAEQDSRTAGKIAYNQNIKCDTYFTFSH